jgi:TPP-dependent pyruvate/acetoin dehydrogenase alpha subunit
MHIADFPVGMLRADGVVAAGIPIATGAAHALKILRTDRRWPASSATAPSTAARSSKG